MRRWVREFGLGIRLVVTGGRPSWTRLGLTAVGVGLGVALLLLAASVPGVLAHRHQRVDGRDVTSSNRPTDTSVRYVLLDGSFRDHSLYGVVVQPVGRHPSVPPGLSRLPGAGEMVVSPAMRAALSTPDGAQLRARYPYRIVGTIGDDGLAGPREYAFYLGSDELDGRWQQSTQTLDRWGAPRNANRLDPTLVLVLLLGVVALLMPVAVFVATAVRFGSEARDRQQAALRLIGADRWATRRIAAAEALLGALLGLVVGVGFFLAGRQLVGLVSVMGISAFPGDVVPDPVLAALIALGLPVAAVLVTLVALRRVTVEPLGVVRRSTARRRRLWWRLAPPVIGLALLVPLIGKGPSTSGQSDTTRAGLGIALVLAGAATLLPWLVERAVSRLRGGGVARLLAVRRLQTDTGGTARVVSGITIAVAGAIALQTLFAGVDHRYEKVSVHESPVHAIVTVDAPFSTADRADLASRLGAVRGVAQAYAFGTGFAETATGDAVPLVVGDCATLRGYAGVARCADGDVFSAATAGTPPLPAGTRVTLGVDREQANRWHLPASTVGVPWQGDPGGASRAVLLTPRAAAAAGLPNSLPTTAYVRADHADDVVDDRIRTAAARISPLIGVQPMVSSSIDARFGAIRTGLLLGSIAVLIVIGASLLVTVLEQVRARRRPLAVLAAFGTRRGTIGRSVLWQTAIPVVLGLGVALLVGAVLGGVLLRMSGQPMSFDWTGALGIAGAGAAVVLLVTALSLPAVGRMMRPEAMRTE
ncbi:MAG TPA: ABC transporter permease [Actinocatenispora sp.]